MLGGGAGGVGDLFVMRAVGEEARQGVAPRGDVLRGDVGDRVHTVVQLGTVAGDGVDGEEVGNAHFGFGDAADVSGHDGDATEHGFDHDAGARLGPKGWREEDAGAGEEEVDIVDGVEEVDIGAFGEGGEVALVGAPEGDGGEGHVGKEVGEGEEDGDSLDGAGVHHGHEFVVEAAEGGRLAGFEKRDGDVGGVHLAVFADVAGDVLADADDAGGGANARGVGRAGEGAIGPEGERDGGAGEVNGARGGRAEGGFEEDLRGVVRGGEDDIGMEVLGLDGEIGAQFGGGDDVDLDVGTVEDEGAGGRLGRDAAGGQFGEVAGFLRGAEDGNAGDGAAGVTAGGEGLHEQAVGLVAAAVRRVVERVLGQQNAH